METRNILLTMDTDYHMISTDYMCSH